MYRIAINGFGRIGRNVLRSLLQSQLSKQFEVVAINDLGKPEVNAHLLQFDTTHGALEQAVSFSDNTLSLGSKRIAMLNERDPSKLPWAELAVDLVLECSGVFTQRDKAAMHLQAGANKVLVSAPGKDLDATIVFGVNHNSLKADHLLVSNASCTTNCLAPVTKVLHKSIGVEKGLANTVHAYTNDQSLLDAYHSDPRRARAAARSMIPSKTGAAAAIGLVIPELDGKMDGLAVRVPVLNVSLLDLTFNAKRPTTVQEVNEVLAQAAKGSMAGVMDINELPLVSSDFNHNPASCIVDLTQTKVDGDLVKILAWYDNEWGFSNRMLDTANEMLGLGMTHNVDHAA